MKVRKYALWALVAFIAYWLINSPIPAAALAERAWGGLGDAAQGFSRFINALS